MNSEIKILIPSEFSKMNSMPGDPENSVVYGKQTSTMNGLVMIHPIGKEFAMPFHSEQSVIDGIHRALATDQGLIEVQSGLTKGQKKYIYSIVKTRLKPSGVQYILTMHIDGNDTVFNIQAFFNEAGMTGQRDTAIMNAMMNSGKINITDRNGWMRDPYDENYKKGFLMNLSEQSEYDEMFPQHPLSEMRRFIGYVFENN